MKVIQVELQHNSTHLVTWIDCHPLMKLGSIVHLKDDPQSWTVVAIYSQMEKALIRQDWRVGGL